MNKRHAVSRLMAIARAHHTLAPGGSGARKTAIQVLALPSSSCVVPRVLSPQMGC